MTDSTSARFCTTAEAAALLVVTPRRVRALIAAGRLAARRFGRDWLIEAEALAAVVERKSGWPKGKPRH